MLHGQLQLFPSVLPSARSHWLTLGVPTRDMPGHVLAVEARVLPGELQCWVTCACHGCSSLHLDFLCCACSTFKLARVCGECAGQIGELERTVAAELTDAEPGWWEADAVPQVADIAAWLAPLANDARALLDPEWCRALSVAVPDLRRWLYLEALERPEQHAALMEFLHARPSMLRLIKWLGDPTLIELVRTRARVRDVERALETRCGLSASLVRKLPATTRPEAIRRVAARTLPRSDIPAAAADRAHWTHAIARVLETLALLAPLASEALINAVASQASRHYEGMAKLSEVDLDRYLQHVALWGVAAPRSRDATQLMKWVERDTLERHLDIATDVPDEWPPPPFPRFENEEVVITPVCSKNALRAEARRMHHCVATLAREVATGKVALYHVQHRSGPSTLTLTPGPTGVWRVEQHLGPFNGWVPDEVQDLVARWVETSGSRHREG